MSGQKRFLTILLLLCVGFAADLVPVATGPLQPLAAPGTDLTPAEGQR